MKEGKTVSNIKTKKPSNKKNVLPPHSAKPKPQEYSKEFVGILVKMTIPIDTIDKHETVGLLVNNEVKPLASILSFDYLPIKERIEKLKTGKKPYIFVNSETTFSNIGNKGFNYEFRMDGWEYNDESSMRSDSGVNITDSFAKPEKKKGKQKPDDWDKLEGFFGTKVKINLLW
jgi:hypothetical protein